MALAARQIAPASAAEIVADVMEQAVRKGAK
jgi:hypothetical protein